jgi:hypothetical protein
MLRHQNEQAAVHFRTYSGSDGNGYKLSYFARAAFATERRTLCGDAADTGAAEGVRPAGARGVASSGRLKWGFIQCCQWFM